jgi:peptidoglycan-associated lipoprotein
MTMRRVAAVAGSLMLVIVVLAGCHRTPPPVVVPAPQGPPPVNQDSINRANARADSIARAEQARRDAAMRAQARADSIRMANDAAARLAAEAKRTAVQAPVYFDFDKSDIRDDQRNAMDGKLPVLSANPAIRLRIEGNTDDRGSDEYNMALGMRRATAAKRYLVEHGVDGARLETVSHGAEQPVCRTKDEACWAQNRRDEFTITAGGDRIALRR